MEQVSSQKFNEAGNSENLDFLEVYLLYFYFFAFDFRKGQEHMVTSSTVTLPTIRVENAPIYVEMVLPAHGWVRTPMAVSYRIHNHTTRLIDVDLSMEASDAFMFAGHKQVSPWTMSEN